LHSIIITFLSSSLWFVKKYYISDSEIEHEKTRFKEAVSKVKEELKAIIGETPEDFREHASILETHILLLKDKMLYGKTIDSIEKKKVTTINLSIFIHH